MKLIRSMIVGAIVAAAAYVLTFIILMLIDDSKPPQELDVAAAKASVARRKANRELTPHEEQI